jgi:hypothetical protein
MGKGPVDFSNGVGRVGKGILIYSGRLDHQHQRICGDYWRSMVFKLTIQHKNNKRTQHITALGLLKEGAIVPSKLGSTSNNMIIVTVNKRPPVRV